MDRRYRESGQEFLVQYSLTVASRQSIALDRIDTIPLVARWHLLLAPLVLALCGCERIASESMTASERFQVQAKCADEAREFENQWKKDNGTDFTVLMFRRHYSLANGKCYSFDCISAINP